MALKSLLVLNNAKWHVFWEIMLWPVLINDDNGRWALFVCLMMESLSMLIVTFQLQYCKSSSGDEVDCLHVTMCSTLVCCYWCNFDPHYNSGCWMVFPHWSSLIGCFVVWSWVSRLQEFWFHYPYWCCWDEALYG